MSKKRRLPVANISSEEMRPGLNQQAEEQDAGGAAAEDAAPVNIEELTEPTKPPPAIPVEASVTLPLCEDLPSEFGIHIDTDIPPPAATTLRRIAIALDRRQATLASGVRVTNPTQALRYLLEQMTLRPAELGGQ
jgi:hypothetical protein